MYAKCTKCNSNWNISIKTDLSKPYVCPVCRGKEKIDLAKRKGVVRNVLIKNRKKLKT
ncbi:hypothetical protein [Clostridium butyricum]|jgi:hypothetical protein|uniref:Uncharacterized protein n=2 Tax=Clostridium butyricum TaxID=1492 RepID=C4IFA3_CLOBU|nr:hypothetical protein [Clostridium butyricum]EDT76370.1 hypothetical protein CBY_1143 [Clostridium butyricum 5521]EEP55036.1 hypothetical protein CLP_1607 [Clostridium butyricum E4 str. BoNT E BL5262]MCI3010213.1 hypothetical protein [Clostridium butyricum]MDM8131480.1 hypothetical protein [Clostridium butyricum]MDM8227916.1 hypothetical protein [Clostridium butyricum]